MFSLKIPHKTACDYPIRDGVSEVGMYATLDEAIHAALDADLDLEAAVIEKRGISHSVNEWISLRIAGGDIWLG